jgi:hypothetical protein
VIVDRILAHQIRIELLDPGMLEKHYRRRPLIGVFDEAEVEEISKMFGDVNSGDRRLGIHDDMP